MGVTSNLVQRAWQHREGAVSGFPKKYAVKRLVYFELHDEMYAALTREKQLKKWRRTWKLELIETLNPDWEDLWQQII